jgi:hypothetical protein
MYLRTIYSKNVPIYCRALKYLKYLPLKVSLRTCSAAVEKLAPSDRGLFWVLDLLSDLQKGLIKGTRNEECSQIWKDLFHKKVCIDGQNTKGILIKIENNEK